MTDKELNQIAAEAARTVALSLLGSPIQRDIATAKTIIKTAIGKAMQAWLTSGNPSDHPLPSRAAQASGTMSNAKPKLSITFTRTPEEQAEIESGIHAQASESWVSREIAATWPEGICVLIYREHQPPHKRPEVQAYWRPDWAMDETVFDKGTLFQKWTEPSAAQASEDTKRLDWLSCNRNFVLPAVPYKLREAIDRARESSSGNASTPTKGAFTSRAAQASERVYRTEFDTASGEPIEPQ